MSLSDTDRIITWTTILNRLSQEVDIADSVVRNAILAAIGATDDWVEANQASYNTALPEPFRTWATPQQKALVLAYVVMRRYNSG